MLDSNGGGESRLRSVNSCWLWNVCVREMLMWQWGRATDYDYNTQIREGIETWSEMANGGGNINKRLRHPGGFGRSFNLFNSGNQKTTFIKRKGKNNVE